MTEADTFADEGIAAFVAGTTLGADLTAADIAELRAGSAQRGRDRPRGPDVPDVRDLPAPHRPARLFRPLATDSGPVVLWLHGGGWAFGGPDTHDRMARRLAAASGAAVLVLDYRLAPEHPWPAAVDDTVTTLEWLAQAPLELGFRTDGGDRRGRQRGRCAGGACLPAAAGCR